MQPDLNRVIEQVSKEKGIDREIIVKALEEAMLSAAKKTFGHEKNIEAKFNTDLGEVELFEIKTVVEVVEDAENQVRLPEARAKLDPDAEVGDELLAKLSADNHSLAVEIASVPDEIRGFGYIKMRNLAAARKKHAELLARFENPQSARAAA